MKLLFLSILVALSNLIYAQQITFEQVQNLRKMSLGDIEEYLVSKSWIMTDASASNESTMGWVDFGYDINMFDSKKATAWLTYYNSNVGNDFNRLSIQIHSNETYKNFLTRLEPNGYKLKKSKINNGSIEKVYSNNNTTCIVETTTGESTYSKLPVYKFFF